MQLQFLSIEVENFKSFTAKQRLDLPQTSGLYFMRGQNLVEPRLGANGSGKSSVWDALCWCIYSKTPEGLRGPDLKAWGSSKTPKVTLRLAIDEQDHVVTRTATTNGLSIDGTEVGNEEAARLIGINFDTFVNTILLAQGMPLFYDRTPKDKMQLFADVLQLERWEDRSDAASKKARALENLEAEMTGELTGLNAALAQATELQAKAKQQSAEWEDARRQRAEQAALQLKQQEALLAERELKLGEAALASDAAETELKASRGGVAALEAKWRKHLFEKNEVKNFLAAKEAEIDRLNRELKVLGVSDKCPTCNQPVKGTSFGKHKAEIARQLGVLEREAKTLERASIVANKACSDAQAHADRNNAAIAVFERKAEEARTHLDYLKPQVAELKAEVLALTAAKSERDEQTNPYTEQVQALRRKVSQLEAQIGELKEDLEKAARQIERTRFWVEGFKDVQLYVIAEVLEELELVTNIMLAEVGLEDWRVHYSLEKETKAGTIQRGLTVSILSPANKAPVRYKNWSGGEGQRLRIVGALALSQVLLGRAGVDANLEVLDEPTRHLSTQGADDLCAYLTDRAKQLGKQIWFIDHLTRESSRFAGVVTVVKTTAGSKIEQ